MKKFKKKKSSKKHISNGLSPSNSNLKREKSKKKSSVKTNEENNNSSSSVSLLTTFPSLHTQIPHYPPKHLPGLVRDWPAFTKWQDVNYFRSICEVSSNVDVACSSSGIYSGTVEAQQSVTMPLGDFLDYYDLTQRQLFNHPLHHSNLQYYLAQTALKIPSSFSSSSAAAASAVSSPAPLSQLERDISLDHFLSKGTLSMVSRALSLSLVLICLLSLYPP